jgi:hypothetical protein
VYGGALYGGVAGAAVTSITPTGIASTQAFGASTVTVIGPTQTVTPTGIGSAQAFGAATVIPGVVVSPTGIASAEAFGTSTVTISQPLLPTGIPSGEAFGTKIKVQRQRSTTAILTTGIPSAEAAGTPTVTVGATYVYPVGIPSAETFGLGQLGRPFILPAPTGTGPLPLMLVRRSGLRH